MIRVMTVMEKEQSQEWLAAARARGISRAQLIREAVETYLAPDARPCPICDGPTVPDPQRPGCRWCDRCQEPVAFGGAA